MTQLDMEGTVVSCHISTCLTRSLTSCTALAQPDQHHPRCRKTIKTQNQLQRNILQQFKSLYLSTTAAEQHSISFMLLLPCEQNQMSFHKTAKASSKSATTSEKNKFKFQQATSAIAGTADGLKRQLAKLEAGRCTLFEPGSAFQ